MVYIKLIHQLLCPRPVSERTIVAIPHNVPQFVKHHLAGIRIGIMAEPSTLIRPEHIASAQPEHSISRINQSYPQ